MYTERIIITVKARTIVKIVIAISATRIFCRVAEQIVMPYVQDINRHLNEKM